MVILTAANSDLAKNDSGVIYKNFSFSGVISATTKQARKNGYLMDVYDLGTLGIGKPFKVSSESFATKGYYEREIKGGYKSKSLFKPAMVKYSMSQYDDFIVYLDGDAQLCGNIDEINTNDYDIGVTLRKISEIESEWHQEHFEIVKYLNAGVIFFNKTVAAKQFVDTWEKETDDVGNDQMALNKLACPDFYPKPYDILLINDIRIKYFPGELYNFYYFDEGFNSNIKIYHFKGPVRKYYPFEWKKRLYCQTIARGINILRNIKS